MESLLRPDLATLRYKPVKPLDVLSAEIGLPESALVKLDANENLWDLPESLRASMSECCMHIYPDPLQLLLRKDLSEYHNVNAENIVAGAGSDDLLDVVIRMIDTPSLIISTPTFGMYSFLAHISKVGVVDVPRLEAFKLDVAGVLAAIATNKSRLAIFASPNNPTGNSIPNADVETLCSSAPHCLFVIDEAYADFASETAEGLLSKYDNLMILRTFSKWAGLAGLRIGYGIGHKVLIDKMIAIKQPYNVNAAAERASRTALKERKQIEVSIRGIIEQRDRLFLEFGKYPFLVPFKSDANFVLCKTEKFSAGGIALALRCQGVLIRFFGAQGGDLEKFFRVSAGRKIDIDRFFTSFDSIIPKMEAGDEIRKAIEASAGEEGEFGLLFDMDGVLAEVSKSYRKSIVQTAAHYQVSITEDDISVEKKKGNANNDWALSHRMITERWNAVGNAASPPSLEQVTEVFENIYQGTASSPGLKASESLICPPPLLRALAEKYKCGIVTGRPRRDCEFFLNQHGLASLFTFCACMEDAALKPSGEPTLLALAKINCKRGLLIGDTVDDIKSALAAGIWPGGVPPPSEVGKGAEKTLQDAGARFIFTPGLLELAALI